MQENAEDQPQNYAYESEDYIFTEHIGGGFLLIEAQHLKGGYLPLALCYVYVGEVIKDHKGQQAGTDNQYYHHRIKPAHNVVKIPLQPGYKADRLHVVYFKQFFGGVLFQFLGHFFPVRKSAHHHIKLGLAIKEFLINGAGHVNIIINIIFSYARNRGFIYSRAALGKGKIVPYRKS